ncbi:hypothetical protein [Escherichia phage PJNS034]
MKQAVFDFASRMVDKLTADYDKAETSDVAERIMSELKNYIKMRDDAQRSLEKANA